MCIRDRSYIGHSIHNKQSNISFKNKKKVRKPQEEWYSVENTHEAIISEEVFQKVQELSLIHIYINAFYFCNDFMCWSDPVYTDNYFAN